MLAFYDARRRKYAAVPPAKIEAARNAPVAKLATFHPNWLEYALDDNSQARMLCGGDAHDARLGALGAAELACAREHLTDEYAFVGVLDRCGAQTPRPSPFGARS